MKRLCLLFAFLGMGLSSMSIVTAQDPPILDRQLFFGNPEISSGELSPDGKMISFLKATNGIMNIWVKDFDAPFEKARPITDSPRPLYGYSWTEDGKFILYVKDKDGDENLNVFAVDPHEAVPAGELPESRNLTPMDGVTAQLMHVSQKDPDLLWVGLNNRDEAWHDLYQLRISSGNLKLLYENTDRITSYDFDWDDRLRLLSRIDEQGTTTILRKEEDNLVPLYETSVTENAAVVGWDASNEHCYLVTNKGDLDLSTLFIMNPKTGEMKLFERDPENRVDFGSLQLDRNTRQPIVTSYVDDRVRYYWKDAKWKANYEFLKGRFPGREVTFQSSTNDYSKFLVAVSGDKYATEAWFFDAQTRALIPQYTPRPDLKAVEQHLAPMTPIRYKSSDGLEIPAYITLPVGKEPKNLPLMVLVHGGPKGPRDNWGYDPEVQFLANRGYAILQPNYRASGGYGKAFLNAGDQQWGQLMQDDITWGVQHVVAEGIADPKRIGIMGGSYGGYATLAGLAFTPELYACGVDIVGPSNIFTLLESIPPYWEAARAFLYGMVGDPNTEEGRAMIQRASPLFHATDIIKPLLIVQGANDPRVKQAEADQIVIALRDRGHDVNYLLAEDEGHGFAKPVNQMAMYAEVERFLAAKLGGRYQPDMPDDVAKRLAELRVDLSSVTYTNPKETPVAAALPAFEPNIQDGTENWVMQIVIQGQILDLEMERTIARRGQHWVISDSTPSPLLGDSFDSAVYSKALEPVSRSIRRGEITIELTFSEGRVEIQENGKSRIVPYVGALVCDGPGRDAILASLPLELEKPLVVMMPDLNAMTVSPHRVVLAGKTKLLEIPCLELTVTNLETPAQKTTLWLNAATRRVEQVVQILPALGNATLTMKRSK